MNDRIAEFDSHRSALFGIAYRMLGTIADAEDIVQEAFLRWRDAPRDEIESPRAYLTTIVTRLAIDHLRSARVRRETYVGPWLPEPIVTDAPPDEPVELAESLSMAFLVLLEMLTPAERAALLLRDVFDYEYAEIATTLGRTEAACRQLVKRARARLAERRPRFEAPLETRERLLHEFMAAVASGDIDRLVALLASDATLVSDGGGKALAALNPILGPDRVARFLLGVAKKIPPDASTRLVSVNGEVGFVVAVDGRQTVVTLEIGPDGIRRVFLVSNPDKLGRTHVA